MKTRDVIPVAIFINNNKYFIKIKDKRYYTQIEATKASLKYTVEYKKELYLMELGIKEEPKVIYFILTRHKNLTLSRGSLLIFEFSI